MNIYDFHDKTKVINRFSQPLHHKENVTQGHILSEVLLF